MNNKTLKKFISYYKPYLGVFILDMVCACIISMMDLIIPFITSYLIKEVFTLQDTSLMFTIVSKYSLILLFVYLIKVAASYYVNYQGHVMGAYMETDMRRDLFAHLEKLSFSYYDKNNTGVMMSRITSDLFDVTEFAHHGPEDLFISTIKLLGSFIILSNVSVNLTLILILIVVVMFISMFRLNKSMKKAFMDNRKKIGSVNSIVQDSLSGIRVVKSFSNEELEMEKFQKGNSLFLKSKKNSYKAMGSYSTLNTFFQSILYLAVFFFGAYFIKQGSMKSSDILTYILYINMFLQPINQLINFTEQYQRGLTGFERMMEVLNTDPDIVDKENPIEVKKLEGNIEFKNVSFKYNDDEIVLENINIKIEKGKTFALVGPSGAGKTTFCSLIPRFYDVSGGELLIDNINIKDMQLQSLRENIGIVQQDVYIFNSTIKENIGYGNPNASFEEIIEAAKKANIHDFIISLDRGYDTEVGERGVRFSGGQKQRLSIARVFLKNPPILILDEATSSLDNESERFIQKSLEELSKNRTTIVIAHRLSTIKNSDEIIVLTSSGIKEQGNHDSLINEDGLYSNLYNMQFQ